LEGVLGVGFVQEQAAADAPDQSPVAVEDRREGRLIPISDESSQQQRIGFSEGLLPRHPCQEVLDRRHHVEIVPAAWRFMHCGDGSGRVSTYPLTPCEFLKSRDKSSTGRVMEW